MQTTRAGWLYILARTLISLIFIVSGLSKIFQWNETIGYMTSKGLPGVPILLAAAIVIEVGGGLAILLGFRARAAALVVFLYLIPVTLIFHNFWSYQGMERQMQMVNLLKNFAVMGGLLEIFLFGAGLASLDYRRSRTLTTQEAMPIERLRRVS